MAAVIACPLSAFSQGQITWGNFLGSPAAPTARSPIYGVDPANPTLSREGNNSGGVPIGTQTYGGALLSGTGFTLGLFVTPVGQTQRQVDTTPFRTGPAAGFMITRTPTVANLAPGSVVMVQFRAWDNQMGTVTAWSQVMAAGGQIAGGSGSPFDPGLMGGTDPVTGAVFPVPQTLGVRSFNLTVVPEPSLIALGALGLGALLLRRRK